MNTETSIALTWPSQGKGAALRPAGALPEGTADTDGTGRLLKPAGVAVNAGRVFVADTAAHSIVVYDRKAGTAVRWSGTAQFPLTGPVALAFDPDGRLFVVDGYLGQIIVLDPAGKPVAALGKGVLSRPSAIAIDPGLGRIYVADVRLHQVLTFDLRTFAPGKTIGGPSRAGVAEPGLFNSPAGLAVNSKGLLLVTDTFNCRAQLFAAGGALVRAFPVQCLAPGEVGRAHLVAIGRNDRLFVAEPDDGSLQIFSPDGKPLQFITAPPAAKPSAVFRTGLALDDQNRIYAVEQSQDAGRIRIFASSFSPKGNR